MHFKTYVCRSRNAMDTYISKHIRYCSQQFYEDKEATGDQSDVLAVS